MPTGRCYAVGMNAVELTLFNERLNAICDEMGLVLQRTALSPNIKDRLDFSCAIFDAGGRLSAQAAHIPVHLGSMAHAMADLVVRFSWQPGDMVVVNDPYLGGTHLPDITVIAPVFAGAALCGFVANRAHHADIGAHTPGSMPIATRLEEEGIVIAPTRFMVDGAIDDSVLNAHLNILRNPELSRGDFMAQVSANRVGAVRLAALIAQLGAVSDYVAALAALNEYGRRMAQSGIGGIPNGSYVFADVMEDDGQGNSDLVIAVRLDIADGEVTADFSGTAAQVAGNINCPLAVVAAAVYYVFRCLMPDNTPACAGTFAPLRLHVPPGSMLNPYPGAAVAAGNVETSMRLVDVVLGALAQALPERIPAASQGTMNNVAMGSGVGDTPVWDYYETLAGGAGAGPKGDGASAIQLHMTNTRNTPIESVEMHYPLRIVRYQLAPGARPNEGHAGGHGLIREYEFLRDTQVTLLTERRRIAPWGLHGAAAGSRGENRLDGQLLPAKTSFVAKAGQRLSIQTPGGGHWREPLPSANNGS